MKSVLKMIGSAAAVLAIGAAFHAVAAAPPAEDGLVKGMCLGPCTTDAQCIPRCGLGQASCSDFGHPGQFRCIPN